MNSTPKAKKRWWETLALWLEAYVVLVSIALYYIATHSSRQHPSPKLALAFALGGYAVCFLGLLASGTALLFHRKASRGFFVLGFAGLALVLLWFFLPMLAEFK